MAEFSKQFTQTEAGTFNHNIKLALEMSKISLLSVSNDSDEDKTIKVEINIATSPTTEPDSAKILLKGKLPGSGSIGEIISKNYNKPKLIGTLDNIQITTTSAATYTIFGTGVQIT